MCWVALFAACATRESKPQTKARLLAQRGAVVARKQLRTCSGTISEGKRCALEGHARNNHQLFIGLLLTEFRGVESDSRCQARNSAADCLRKSWLSCESRPSSALPKVSQGKRLPVRQTRLRGEVPAVLCLLVPVGQEFRMMSFLSVSRS